MRRYRALPRVMAAGDVYILAFGLLVIASAALLGGADAPRLAVGSVGTAVAAWFVLPVAFDREVTATHAWVSVAVLTFFLAAMGLFEGISHVDLLSFSGGVLPQSGVSGVPRANGPFASDVEYGLTLLMGLAFLLGGWTRTRMASRVQRWFAGATAALAVPAVYLTYFRTTWIVAVVLLGIWTYRRGRRIRIAAAGVVLVAAVIFAVSISTFSNNPIVKTRVTSSENISGRAATYSKALSIFADHPLVGVGFANFSSDARYVASDGVQSLSTPHSAYLGVLSELGLTGFVLLVAALAAIATEVRRLIRWSRGSAWAAYGRGAWWATVVLIVFGVDFEVLSVPFPVLLLFSIAGICVGVNRAGSRA